MEQVTFTDPAGSAELPGLTGAHPTTGQFTQQLLTWGFTQRRADGVHLVFRGPHGGTIRVLRSPLGRSDSALAAKAARLAGISERAFWAGPRALAASTPDAAPEPEPEPPAVPARGKRRPSPGRDSITSLVLAAHTLADRPLGFDQVVQLCHGRITRGQARTASAQLCRDGDLDRIRAGVYQWSSGTRAIPAIRPITSSSAALRAVQPLALITPPSQVTPPDHLPGQTARPAEPGTAASLFTQLFPDGVHMTASLLADFEQWAQLTSKLTSSPPAS